MRTKAALIIMLIASTSVYAQNFDYRCYGGILSNPASKDVTEVRIGITKAHHAASFVAFYGYDKSPYSTDIFCAKNFIGKCSLLDDSGSFQILAISANKMTIQFDGIPKLMIREGDKLPVVDSSVKLKTPIRMDLTAHQKSDCTY